MTNKQTRYANLKLLIEEAGGKTIDLVNKVGGSESYFSQILTGVKSASGTPKGVGNATARKLEIGMNKPEGWMDVPHTHKKHSNGLGYSNTIDLGIEFNGSIPLISYVEAGPFCEAIDNFEPGDAEEWLPKPPNTGARSFALTVSGDSMTSPVAGQPSFPEGGIIIIDPEAEAKIGDFVIAKDTGKNEATFKKLVQDSGVLYLKPINPQYAMIEVTQDIKICGRVTGFHQRF